VDLLNHLRASAGKPCGASYDWKFPQPQLSQSNGAILTRPIAKELQGWRMALALHSGQPCGRKVRRRHSSERTSPDSLLLWSDIEHRRKNRGAQCWTVASYGVRATVEICRCCGICKSGTRRGVRTILEIRFWSRVCETAFQVNALRTHTIYARRTSHESHANLDGLVVVVQQS